MVRRTVRRRRTSGAIIARDLRSYRDELVVSSKAGYDMWPGPYGDWGSRKYLLASLDQTPVAAGLDYVDIFYSHRFDPLTPLEETMSALDTAVRQGKALYAGVSSYSAARTREAAAILRAHGHAVADLAAVLFDAQPVDRGRSAGRPGDRGRRVHRVLAPGPGPAHGQVPRRRPGAVRAASGGGSFPPETLRPELLERVRGLAAIATRRGQSLAQMALAWALRDPRVTSALVGAGSVAQLEENLAALAAAWSSRPSELAEIDVYAQESGINLWAASSET